MTLFLGGGQLYPSVEKLGLISILCGYTCILGGVFFKFIYTVVCMQIHVSAIKIPLLLDTTLLIKFVRLVAGRRFSQYTPSIKQDSHDITEILLKGC